MLFSPQSFDGYESKTLAWSWVLRHNRLSTVGMGQPASTCDVFRKKEGRRGTGHLSDIIRERSNVCLPVHKGSGVEHEMHEPHIKRSSHGDRFARIPWVAALTTGLKID